MNRGTLLKAHYGRSNEVGDVSISQHANPSLLQVRCVQDTQFEGSHRFGFQIGEPLQTFPAQAGIFIGFCHQLFGASLVHVHQHTVAGFIVGIL